MNIHEEFLSTRIASWIKGIQRDFGSKIYNSRQTLEVAFVTEDGEELVGTFTMGFERIADQTVKADPARPLTKRQRERDAIARQRGDL